MAYQKTDWVEYETLVSAFNLNKIENQLQKVTLSTEINEMAIKSTDAQLKDLSKNLQTTTETVMSHKSETANKLMQQTTEINRLRKMNNEQSKELSYLKLKQKASDRIEGGTTFADDMKGNGFGITFNKELSENVVIKDGALTMNEGAMVEVNVDNSVVASGNYSTQGNGGRKLVRLDNGTLVCVYRSNESFYLHKSVDNGSSWTSLPNVMYGSIQDVCIQTDGTYIYMLIANNNKYVAYRVIDVDGKGVALYGEDIQHTQNALGTCSLAINPEGTELHACWSSKNSTYPNSFNLQYAKGIIGEGGYVTWGSVKQVSTYTASTAGCTYPSIILNALGNPVILCTNNVSSTYRILVYCLDNDGVRGFSVNELEPYQQGYPSAIFVPKSVNGLENGRIWVAWYGVDSTDTTCYNIRVSYSDDNGKTWSGMNKLTSGNSYSQVNPSITANKDNEIFITWNGVGIGINTSYHSIKQIKWSNGGWGNIDKLKPNSGNSFQHPNSLYDIAFKTDFTKPLFVYTEINTAVNFTGSWKVGSHKPTTTATAVYKLPSTDYVGMFVQKEGNVNITATINDIPMNSEINGNEYQFTKALASEAPVTLKLSLSRDNTTNGDADKVTRILGGMS